MKFYICQKAVPKVIPEKPKFWKHFFNIKKREEMYSLLLTTFKYEKHESIEKKDLKFFNQHELIFLEKCARASNSLFQPKSRDSMKIEDFFNNVKPDLSYDKFILNFIKMLYHEYVFVAKTNNPTADFMVFSQAMTQAS